MSRKRFWLTVGLIVAVAATVVTLMYLRDNKSSQNESPDVSLDVTSTPAIEMFTEEDSQYIEEKFNSPSKEEQELALEPEMRAGEWGEDALFPEGAVFEVDHSSFKGDDENGYTVQSSVVLDGEVIQAFTLTVEYVESENAWLVVGTTQIEGE